MATERTTIFPGLGDPSSSKYSSLAFSSSDARGRWDCTRAHTASSLLHPEQSHASNALSVLELCAGGGGQALGFEAAGFQHTALVEIDPDACATLRRNRPSWNVLEQDLNYFDAIAYRNKVDIIAAGVPCPPFSRAGKQLGELDERFLLSTALDIIHCVNPKAVLLENVPGLLDARFQDLRDRIVKDLCGYRVEWRLLKACDFGVPQLRPRAVMVALRKNLMSPFRWPQPPDKRQVTVGEALHPLMSARFWGGADDWARNANRVAPTLVGGSRRHGGPDLGPTRSRSAWATLDIEGKSLANEAPGPGFVGMPRLTLEMVAKLQGFPADWQFVGGKTSRYRAIANAFPPAVACALAKQLAATLTCAKAQPTTA